MVRVVVHLSAPALRVADVHRLSATHAASDTVLVSLHADCCGGLVSLSLRGVVASSLGRGDSPLVPLGGGGGGGDGDGNDADAALACVSVAGLVGEWADEALMRRVALFMQRADMWEPDRDAPDEADALSRAHALLDGTVANEASDDDGDRRPPPKFNAPRARHARLDSRSVRVRMVLEGRDAEDALWLLGTLGELHLHLDVLHAFVHTMAEREVLRGLSDDAWARLTSRGVAAPRPWRNLWPWRRLVRVRPSDIEEGKRGARRYALPPGGRGRGRGSGARELCVKREGPLLLGWLEDGEGLEEGGGGGSKRPRTPSGRDRPLTLVVAYQPVEQHGWHVLPPVLVSWGWPRALMTPVQASLFELFV